MESSDVSSVNDDDLISQLGHIIILTDDSGLRKILSCAGYKTSSVLISVLGAETYTLADCSNQTDTIHNELLRITRGKLSSTLLTGCICLLKIIIQSSKGMKKRLTIDLHAVRKAFPRRGN